MDAKTPYRGADTKHAPNLMDRCSIGVNSIPQYAINHIEIDKLRRNPAALILSYSKRHKFLIKDNVFYLLRTGNNCSIIFAREYT